MKKLEFKNLIREEIRKVLNEAARPVSDKKYTDDQLTDFFTNDDDVEEWFTMFADDAESGGYWHPQDSVIMANDFLKERGYKFRVKKAVSKDDGQNITWTIK